MWNIIPCKFSNHCSKVILDSLCFAKLVMTKIVLNTSFSSLTNLTSTSKMQLKFLIDEPPKLQEKPFNDSFLIVLF